MNEWPLLNSAVFSISDHSGWGESFHIRDSQRTPQMPTLSQKIDNPSFFTCQLLGSVLSSLKKEKEEGKKKKEKEEGRKKRDEEKAAEKVEGKETKRKRRRKKKVDVDNSMEVEEERRKKRRRRKGVSINRSLQPPASSLRLFFFFRKFISQKL